MEIESVSCNFNGIDERNKSAKIAEMDKIIAELKKKIKDTERYIANCESGSKSEVFVHQKKDKLKNELLDEVIVFNWQHWPKHNLFKNGRFLKMCR